MERLSKTAREEVEGLEDIMVGWGDRSDKWVWMGESLLRI